MDANRFDQLARSLSVAGSRRGVLRLIIGLPPLGGLAVFLAEQDETDAKNRRKKRKKPHKRAKRRRQHQTKQRHCRAHAHAKVCAGKCGKVKNNCKKTITCGSCDCSPSCGICQTCQGSPRVCVQEAVGTPCGETGQVCQGDGACACGDDTCPSGCCANDGSCQPGTSDDVCGADAESCQACSGDTPVCWNGDCVCGDVCASGCQFSVLQDAIDTLPSDSTIRLCAETYGGGAFFGDNEKVLTLRGVGQGGDGTILDGQQSGSAVHVFNGTSAHVHDLRITGATDSGVFVPGGTVTLTDCTITGNASNLESDGGGGVFNRGQFSSTTLTNCTVSFNETPARGGGILTTFGTVTLNDTEVTDNTAGDIGGGINNDFGTINLNGTSSVFGNDPDNCNGNGSGTYNGSGCEVDD